ncbi:GNAT family N-acetyltransferase [Paenibacillus lutimineralis]|uniref:N-acetyltransferase n=1 Tax=Paenibacillus lutimineralis TaxID=2707005 RepID=A0A3Q9I8I2_9BACL|nr:GNAT family protein [Paenibacillus lutimineralis]AZS15092.1 N-acetyltransferase [Paenibacillus lutimineralis]
MKYFRKIEGPRIYLSPINAEDVETYTKWINNMPLSLGLGSASQSYSLLREKNVLENLAKENHNYAIVLQETDELLGNCSLFAINEVHRTAELGIFIGEETARNKGYGTEAIQLLTEYGFKILNLNNIMLKLYEFNHSAYKCYDKAGFREFGRRSRACHLNGAFYDDIYMEMVPKDMTTSFLNSILPKKNMN